MKYHKTWGGCQVTKDDFLPCIWLIRDIREFDFMTSVAQRASLSLDSPSLSSFPIRCTMQGSNKCFREFREGGQVWGNFVDIEMLFDLSKIRYI